jgi:hypothetical protein
MKRIAFVSLLIFFASQLYAQHFMAGLSVAPIVTDVQGTDTRDFDNDFVKLGYSFGLFVNRQMDEKNIIQFEINLVQKGAEQLPDSNNNGYFKLALNYVEVPVLIRHRMHFGVNSRFYNNFEWELGLSGGYLFGYTYTGGNGYNLTFPQGSMNSLDISVLAGVNYLISPSFYFGVRYSNSLIPVLKHNAIPPQSLNSYSLDFNNGNNLVWAFSLKYIIAGKADSKQ